MVSEIWKIKTHHETETLESGQCFGEFLFMTKFEGFIIDDVQIDKYDWSEEEAKTFSDFLTPMLEFDPDRRASAADCLQSPFLRNIKC